MHGRMLMSKSIEELERELNVKKAYASVQLSFGKGSRFPDDVREEVTSKIKEVCLKLASGEDVGNKVGQFNGQEVEVLKDLVQSIIGKASGSKSEAKPKGPFKREFNSIEDVAKAAQDGNEPLIATLLTTDSIPKDRRKLIDSNENVQILKLNDKEAVIKKLNNNERFVVPIEDLELNQ